MIQARHDRPLVRNLNRLLIPRPGLRGGAQLRDLQIRAQLIHVSHRTIHHHLPLCLYFHAGLRRAGPEQFRDMRIEHIAECQLGIHRIVRRQRRRAVAVNSSFGKARIQSEIHAIARRCIRRQLKITELLPFRLNAHRRQIHIQIAQCNAFHDFTPEMIPSEIVPLPFAENSTAPARPGRRV